MFELMMRAFDMHQIPAVRFNLPDDCLAIHGV
jgi:hypothetical protein